MPLDGLERHTPLVDFPPSCFGRSAHKSPGQAQSEHPKIDPFERRALAKGSSTYGAGDMQVLEGLEPVRKRPGMYIGSTGPSGLHHLVWEVVDNSVDEAMAGYATRIDVTILKDGACRVVDNGRGIPVDINPQYKISGVEIALTKLHD